MRQGALIARAAPFALFMAVLIARPLLEQVAAVVGLDARWVYAVQAGLPLAALVVLWPRYRELGPDRLPDPAGWGLAAVVGAAVFGAWIHLDLPSLTLGASTGFDPRGADGRVILPLAVVRLAGAALVVPLLEELFWRSFLLRWLERPAFVRVAPSEVGWRAILVSSALFATEHHLWFAGLLAGIAYAWLYVRTGTLWAPVLAHALTNGLLGWWVLETGAWSFW